MEGMNPMAQFDDVLLTVDFDRTLTGPDGKIPPRNIEAIEYFMANGGSFTVNTGRSVATFWKYLNTIPHNAPFLLYNGSAAWDNGVLSQLKPIDLDLWEVAHTMRRLFPEMNLEIQGTQVHYLIEPQPELVALYDNLQWRYMIAEDNQPIAPFIKYALFGLPRKPVVGDLFDCSPEEDARFKEAEDAIRQLYAGKVEVFRAAPRIIDVHARGVSKIAAARDLKAQLGKKVLICVGDAENDISMLDGADYAFCPSDGVVADRYKTVCNCGDGAVADVIYKKIPEILGL